MTKISNKSKPKSMNTNIQIEPIKCKNCGAPITHESVSCEYCGVHFVIEKRENIEEPNVCPIRRLEGIDNPTLKDWLDAWYFVFTGKEKKHECRI